MLRIGTAVLLGLTAWISSSSVQAGGWDDFWCGCKADYQFNSQWPKPFIDYDRQAAVAPYHVMIANGWQRQNLIGNNFFDDDTKQLTSAGIHQIHSILLESPAEHRVIFVSRDLSSERTKDRIDQIQQALAVMLPGESLPAVVVSNMQAEGRSAQMVDKEQTLYSSSAPQPRISGSRGAGGGGGGGATGSPGASTGASGGGGT
jgi:hypothetical protein